jgi:hypothetical protein
MIPARYHRKKIEKGWWALYFSKCLPITGKKWGEFCGSEAPRWEHYQNEESALGIF